MCSDSTCHYGRFSLHCIHAPQGTLVTLFQEEEQIILNGVVEVTLRTFSNHQNYSTFIGSSSHLT